MKSKDFPSVPEDLLKALEDAYPDKLPPLGTSPEKLAHLQGQRSVVEFLRVTFEKQNKTILEKT